jgi:protein-disulfide isomerase
MSMLKGWPGLALAIAVGLLLSVALAWFRPLAARAVSPGLVAAIVRDGAPPVIGPADADVTLIVFSDYRCGPCRRAHPALMRAVAADGRVRIVTKELPIFGPRSHEAARVALAAGEQGLYAPVNDALMRERRGLNEAVMREVVIGAGGDWKRLQRDLRRFDSAIEDRLATNAVQAHSLAIPGTPAYIAGRWLFVGALDERGFRRLIAKGRAE